MEKKPLFSIIIPTYNYAHTLTRAVKSVLHQITDDVELLIINDGSSDNTIEMMAELESNYPNTFKGFHQKKNLGLAATKNRGIRESSGDWLVFLDADDELTPEALLLLQEAVQTNQTAKMIIGAHLSVQPNGRERLRPRTMLPTSKGECFLAYLLGDKLPITNGATAMHRQVFERYQYPDHFRSNEDIPIFAYVLANYKVVTLNRTIAKIHKHSDSLRNRIDINLSVGMDLVDEVFQEQRIPAHLMVHKSAYNTRRTLAIFRSLYRAKDFSHALKYYFKAIHQSPSAIFYGSYFTKAVRAIIKTRLRYE